MPPRNDSKLDPAAAPIAAPAATAAPHAAPPAAYDAADERAPTTGYGRSDCPHCGGELVPHEATEGPKAGAEHCNGCGCCLIDGEPRPGTARCTIGEA